MILRRIVASCVALFAAAAIAGEDLVYESLQGVEIGRVFLSQEQRAVLDQKRKHSASDLASASGTSPAADALSQPALSAGYIIGQDGQAKVWKDGNFLSSPAPRGTTLRFPGDVKIIRHTGIDPGDDPADLVTPADADD